MVAIKINSVKGVNCPHLCSWDLNTNAINFDCEFFVRVHPHVSQSNLEKTSLCSFHPSPHTHAHSLPSSLLPFVRRVERCAFLKTFAAAPPPRLACCSGRRPHLTRQQRPHRRRTEQKRRREKLLADDHTEEGRYECGAWVCGVARSFRWLVACTRSRDACLRAASH